ncbi:SOS response-associated peptidase family protein [Sphingobium sp. CECT 9361]|uniref:SOS response-associated peptidase family protein n=1 Tax=Sphingobium sp. CECT 9361 TaxID=2845384 RepID=UPI0033BACBFF
MESKRCSSPSKWRVVHICNLYHAKKPAAEIASLFGAQIPVAFNSADEVYPGYPGIVAREQDGRRILQSMVWGFPRPMKSKKTGLPLKPRPVNNIADLSNFMWQGIAPEPQWRCLIPVTAFAEAEGAAGRMTRTWISLKDQELFAWAGMWRVSDEWGPVYSGLMTECNEAIRPVHVRMPVLLQTDEYDQWLHGSLDDVLAFQSRTFSDDLIALDRTDEPWFRRKGAEATAAQENML